MCTTFKHKQKRMWEVINNSLGRKVKSSTIERTDWPTTINSPTNIANKLKSHFATCAAPTSLEPNPPTLHQVDSVFHFKPVCVSDVAASLIHHNTHKSTGADGVSAHLMPPASTISMTIVFIKDKSHLNGKE